MSEDIFNKLRRENPQMTIYFTGCIYNEALIIIEDKIQEIIGKSLSEIGMKSPTRQQEMNIDREMLRELSYDTDKMVPYVALNEPLLNIDQQ